MSELNTIETHEPEIAGRVGELVAMSERCEINSQGDAEKASDLLKFIKTAYKKAEEERKSITDPINKSIRTLNAKFKGITEPLKNAESDVKRKILDWTLAEEKRLEEEALAAAEKAESEGGDADLVDAILETDNAPAVTRGDYGSSTSIRKDWKFELEDISKVPVEFLAIDEKAVRAAIKDGKRDIPGLRIFEEKTVVAR